MSKDDAHADDRDTSADALAGDPEHAGEDEEGQSESGQPKLKAKKYARELARLEVELVAGAVDLKRDTSHVGLSPQR